MQQIDKKMLPLWLRLRVKWLSYGMYVSNIKILGIFRHISIPNICLFWYYCLWGHRFMMPTKNDQQMIPSLPPSTEMINRSIISKEWNLQTRDKFQEPPTPFCVDVINVCSLSGFLRFSLSHAWMLMKFWILWRFSQATFC